jgi:hypothetical protein
MGSLTQKWHFIEKAPGFLLKKKERKKRKKRGGDRKKKKKTSGNKNSKKKHITIPHVKIFVNQGGGL